MSFFRPIYSLILLGSLLSENAFCDRPANSVKFSMDSKRGPASVSSAEEEFLSKDCSNEKNCLRQADAFQRATQAATYLGYYMMIQKFDSNTRAQVKEAFAKCFPKQTYECDEGTQGVILGAAIQHNLGKEIRHMVLLNNTNRYNMKSLSPNAEFLFNGKYWIYGNKAKELEKSFRVDPSQVADSPLSLLEKKKFREKEILGDAFMQDYKIFLDTYAKTSGQYGNNTLSDKSRWHLAGTKKVRLSRRDTDDNSGEIYANINNVDQQKFDSDKQSQDQAFLRERLESAKKIADQKDPKSREELIKVSNALMFNPTGIVDEKTGKELDKAQIHRAMAAKLNEAYEEREKSEANKNSRSPASAVDSTSSDKKNVNIVLDMDKFSNFLDEIWPPSVAKPSAKN